MLLRRLCGSEVKQVKQVNKDLQHIYDLLTIEQNKVMAKIDRIDTIISECNRLNVEYWCNVRIETVAFLNGLNKASDIVFRELHK